MSLNPKESHFWNSSLSQNFTELKTTELGLASAEAVSRLSKFGPNISTDERRRPLWLQFLQRFRNPLILLLMAASGLSALTGDAASFFIIASILVISVTFDFYQEVRAEQTVDSLRQSVALKADVIRNGNQMEILVKQIVPGDIVILSPGMLVPADGRLINCKNLYINQSLLTGESFPAEKSAIDLPTPVLNLDEAVNSVFMGTSIISGGGTMVVIETGKRSQLGNLAGQLAIRHPPTAFELGVDRFGLMLLRLAFGMVLFVLLVNMTFHRPFLDSFLFALALAIGLAPELLPMIVTISLTRGAMRMAKQKVILKHLPAMHNLGAMDLLCTDKTGTLTEANIRLEKMLDTDWNESDHVFMLAYINSSFESGMKTPLDQAILNHGKRDLNEWRKIDEVPFDFERRRICVLVASPEKRLLIVKGAPEDILKCSTHYETANGIIDLDDRKNAECLEKFGALGEQGYRVLGVAYREVDASQSNAFVTDETELTFAGFGVFLDPPKMDAAQTLKELARDGIQVKILSGDNERVTRHVCDMLGFHVGKIITGEELENLNEEALLAEIDDINAFCRVTPQQKSRIITSLQRRSHTVGFLGDGINDAPALHVADVGISVDSATDVAKDAADVILLDHDLSVIHAGVIEGRRAVINTEKYILMGSSSTFGNMFTMAVSTLFLPFLPMLPIQVLLNDLLYDLSQTALPFDNVDEDLLAKPVKWDISRIKRIMWVLGPASSIFDFFTFYLLINVIQASEPLFHTVWFVESMVTQTLIIFSIRTPKPVFRSNPHPLLIAVAICISSIPLILPFTLIGKWFGLVPMAPVFYLFPLGCVTFNFVLFETIKRLFRRFI